MLSHARTDVEVIKELADDEAGLPLHQLIRGLNIHL